MSPSHGIQSFIKYFVRDLHKESAAISEGVDLSKGCGYIDRPELFRDIANELGLNEGKEHELVSLAQFHVDIRRISDRLTTHGSRYLQLYRRVDLSSAGELLWVPSNSIHGQYGRSVTFL